MWLIIYKFALIDSTIGPCVFAFYPFIVLVLPFIPFTVVLDIYPISIPLGIFEHALIVGAFRMYISYVPVAIPISPLPFLDISCMIPLINNHSPQAFGLILI